jgi:hypothetical protein
VGIKNEQERAAGLPSALHHPLFVVPLTPLLCVRDVGCGSEETLATRDVSLEWCREMVQGITHVVYMSCQHFWVSSQLHDIPGDKEG